jgi:1-aminocyclopropane-1-carboxylate synthase
MRENRWRLESNYRLARDYLTDKKFNVVPSNAGHFLWVDIGSRLGWKTVDDDEDGFARIFDAGLYIVGLRVVSVWRLDC